MVQSPPRLPSLDTIDGDTLVFISTPPQEPNQSKVLYRQVQAHFCRPFRIHSASLVALHSTFFNKRMAPRVQQRELASDLILQRHQYGPRPPGIRYVLDLTPSTEGEDVIEQIVNLSCPKGVLLWHQSMYRFEMATGLVGGKDEFSSTTPNRPATALELHTGHQRTPSSDAPQSRPATANDDALPPEYSQLRHCLSIQRVLLAIAGQDPNLDSAPKLYSFAMIIKTLGLPGPADRLTDWVLRWMRADPNTRFLEALPEVTLKIAEALMCEVLAQDAFAVLVGEAALDFVCPPAYDRSTASTPGGPHKSAFGRVKTELEERWQDRLEHARISFVDIVNKAAEELTGADMRWVEQLPEVQALMTSRGFALSDDKEVCAATEDLIRTLKVFLRGSICQLLHSRYEAMYNPYKFDKPGGDDLYPRALPKRTWDWLPVEARIFTRAFWDLVFGWSLDIQTFNLQFATNLSATVIKRGYSALPHAPSFGLTGPPYSKVECEAVRQKWKKVAAAVHAAKHGSNRSALTSAFGAFKNTLPIRTAPKGSNSEANSATWSAPSTSSPAIEGPLPIQPKPSTASTPFGSGASTAFAPSTPASADSLLRAQSSTAPLEQSIPRDEFPPGDELASPSFSFQDFLNQAQHHLVLVASEMLGPPIGGGQHIGSETVDVALTNTLVCLRVEQLRLLPLWAGGDDDGSGGAFADCVPNHLGEGFAAGPVPNGRGEGSADGFDMVSVDGESRTGIATSLAVGDGYSDCLDRRRVYDVESVATMETDERDGARTPTGARPETSAAGAGVAGNTADNIEDDDFAMVADEDLMQDDSDGNEDFEMADGEAMMEDDDIQKDLEREKGKNVVYRYLDNISDELLTRL